MMWKFLWVSVINFLNLEIKKLSNSVHYNYEKSTRHKKIIHKSRLITRMDLKSADMSYLALMNFNKIFRKVWYKSSFFSVND